MFIALIFLPVLVICLSMIIMSMSGIRRTITVLGLSMASSLCFELLSTVVNDHDMFAGDRAVFWVSIHSAIVFVLSMLTLLWTDKKAREAD